MRAAAAMTTKTTTSSTTSMATHPSSASRRCAPVPAVRRRHRSSSSMMTKALATQTPAPTASIPSAEYQHPLDRDNTRLLKSIPAVEELTKAVLSPSLESALELEHTSTSVLVSEQQLPKYYAMIQECAAVLGIPQPRLYIKQNPSPNAFTLAIRGKKPIIVAHTSLVELLTDDEFKAVLGHEMGHLACDHGVWLSLAQVLGIGVEFPGTPYFIRRQFEEQLLRWSRSAEYTCDRAALICVREPRIVASALMKLAGGSPKLAAELSVEAFLDQARAYEDSLASASPLNQFLDNSRTNALTHPLPVARAKEIDQWSRSTEFAAIRDRLVSSAPASSN
jgi:Zn-dependent protease with chaperone function